MITPIVIPNGGRNEETSWKELILGVGFLVYFLGLSFGFIEGFTGPSKFLKYKEVKVERVYSWGKHIGLESVENGLDTKKLFPNNLSKVVFTYSAGAVVGMWMAK